MSLGSTSSSGWASVARNFPLPLQPSWLATEIGRSGRPIEIVSVGSALAWVSLVEPDERRVGYTVSDVIAGRRAPVPDLPVGPTAFVGAPGGHLPAIVWDTRLPGPEMLDELVARILAWAQDRGAVGVVIDSVPADSDWSPLSTVLSRQGFLPVRQLPEAVLRIDSSGLDGVLDRLSHSQRKNIRRQRVVFAASGGIVQVGSDRPFASPENVRILCDHYRKYGHDVSPQEAHDRLTRASCLPGTQLLTVAGDQGIRGLSVIAVDRDRRELFARLSACVRDDAFSYFNLVFYARVEFAASRHLALLHYGDESYLPKVQRGCELVGRTTFIALIGSESRRLASACAARGRANLAQVRAELPPSYHHLMSECEE